MMQKNPYFSQICYISCGSEIGTGFLVSPNTVVTALHVVADALSKQIDVEITFPKDLRHRKYVVNWSEIRKFPPLVFLTLHEERSFSGIYLRPTLTEITTQMHAYRYSDKDDDKLDCIILQQIDHSNQDSTDLRVANLLVKPIDERRLSFGGFSGSPIIVGNCIDGILLNEHKEDGIPVRLSGICGKNLKKIFINANVHFNHHQENPLNPCRFVSESYVDYLQMLTNDCSLTSLPKKMFIKESLLFDDLRNFAKNHWLDLLLDEIENIAKQGSGVIFHRDDIDVLTSMEKNVSILKSWVNRTIRKVPKAENQLSQIRRKLNNPFYMNCMFISGYYGSGKTRLIIEAAKSFWKDSSSPNKSVFVFVKPNYPADIEASIHSSFVNLLDMTLTLKECLDIFAYHYTLIIVLDDIHEYFQNNVTIKRIFDIIDKFSRPYIKWILLTQTGYGKDPEDLYSDIYSKYSHKWNSHLSDSLVGPWFQLDNWYRKKDIPQRIIKEMGGFASTEWIWKNSVYSTNYYNPLLANVLISHALKKNDWSILSYNNFLFPEFCNRYFRILSQDKETVVYDVERIADYFWQNHKLHFQLIKTSFDSDRIHCLVNHGLLLKADTPRISYRGSPDIVWYYQLAKVLDENQLENDTHINDILQSEYWYDNPADFNNVLSVWILMDNHNSNDITSVWEMLFHKRFGYAALDSGFKCDVALRNKLVCLALKNTYFIRDNFALFMRLCALGHLNKKTLRDVILVCINQLQSQTCNHCDLFAYMLLQNYNSMKWNDVLDFLSYLTPIRRIGMDEKILCKLGQDLGRIVAQKASDANQLDNAIADALNACNGPESNKRYYVGNPNRNNEFPVELFDGFCSAFCNTIIHNYGMDGYKKFISCNWYHFSKKTNQNELRRNKALTFALAFEYRNALLGRCRFLKYQQWYEDELVRKLSTKGVPQKSFALYLIMHSGLKENHYRIYGNKKLTKIAAKLSTDHSMTNILNRPSVRAFYRANFNNNNLAPQKQNQPSK